jgi:hypothetical protein
MAETATLLADEVFPDVPLRQWVISFPFPLRYLFAAHPRAMGKGVYTLKTPYRDGTTQVAFDRGGHPPVDFIARSAALAWPAASQVARQPDPVPRRPGPRGPARTTAGEGSSRQPGTGKASSPPPTQNSAHPPSAMPR